MSIDSDQFRAAMRHLTGHVCLVTTTDNSGRRFGLTATAVCSVSAEPPTLLCCINRTIQSYGPLVESGHFVINVLGRHDHSLANRFSDPALAGEERFAKGDWSRGTTGAPVLESALASFDCTTTEIADGHSHGIFIGAIQAVRFRSDDAPPLLYSHGAFGSFNPL